MNTKNTKSAIIILLMVANIFFIYSIITLNIRTQNLPSSMIDNAVNILGNRGFSIDRSVIPAKKPANYIYEGVYSGDFKEIVAAFSGVPEDEIQDLPPLLDEKTKYNEGGYTFIFDRSDYFKISIMNEYHEKAEDDYREVETETEAEIAFLTETGGITAVQKSDIKRTEKIIDDFLKKYPNRQKSQNQEIKSDFGFDIISLRKEGGSEPEKVEKVIINQKADGLPVSSHTAYVEIKSGEVQYFYGRWYFGVFVARYKPSLLDSVNILFKYIEYTEKDGNISGEDTDDADNSDDLDNSVNSVKLTKMDLEYNIFHISSNEFYLIPSWTLLFDDGKKLSYNMITGKRN